MQVQSSVSLVHSEERQPVPARQLPGGSRGRDPRDRAGNADQDNFYYFPPCFRVLRNCQVINAWSGSQIVAKQGGHDKGGVIKIDLMEFIHFNHAGRLNRTLVV